MPNHIEFPLTLPAQRAGDAWSAQIDGRELRLSNLGKPYWPDGTTKGDLLTAYYNLAPWILPYLRERPLTMRRMPDGIEGPEFYQKEAPDHTPAWMPRAHITGRGANEDKGTTFLLAEDTASLLYIVNLGCIEFHPWHSRAHTIDRPDYAFFDLDPFPPITFETVRRTALLVRVALEKLGLKSYPKTSGATGMQIYVPLDGSHTYEEARGFVERVCRLINATWPDGTTMEWEIAKRSGKVFLDFGMVSEGKNIASVYSVRPFPAASLSTPLTWDEVEQDIEPSDFTIRTIWSRLAGRGDLFAPVLTGGGPEGQNLSAAMEALGMPAPTVRSVAPAPLTPREKTSPATDATLREYKRKRRFDVTPEPAGDVGDTSDRLSFMIHKHHARRLHYDLRLEHEGVLASWAVPRGLPTEPNVRRLAVHVEDHPLEYGTFEGTIPRGEYGAGEARIFDRGWYEPLEWTDQKVTVVLHGERYQGEYHIVRTKERDWLLFRSTKSPAQHWAGPQIVEPMLATSTAEAFDDPDWTFEVKWDGARTLALIDGEVIKLYSRNLRDVTHQYPELIEGLTDRLSGMNGMIDGEIVALDKDGKPSFEALQKRMNTQKPAARLVSSTPVEYVAFDLLWLDGESLMDRVLEERFDTLSRVLVPADRVKIAQRIDEHGSVFFEQAKKLGLEGLIAKRKGSKYRPGQRSKDWLKIKAVNRVDCVVCGWTPGRGSRGSTMGSLILGVMRDGALDYAGNVGTGFTEQLLKMTMERLAPLITDDPPFPVPKPRPPELKEATWVRPELVCEVEYLEFTSQGRLRAPSFKGFRDDKTVEDAVP